MSDFNAAYAMWRKQLDAIYGLSKVFVVGCAKSGTTWVQNLLHGHPQIVLRGEGRFMWQLAPLMGKAIQAFNKAIPYSPPHPAVIRDQDFQLYLRTIIDSQLVRYVAESPGKEDIRIVGDKTPMHSISMPQLNLLYPDAKFIHIVRDPRDMTNSQWLFWAKDNDSRSLEEFVQYSITHVWPLNAGTARQCGLQLGPQRYCEVRYEDLHTDEHGQLRRLLSFLGVEAGDEAVSQCSAAGDFKTHSGGRARGEGNVESKHLYRKGIVGDWSNNLPEDIVHQSCAQVADLMRAYGYDPSSETVGIAIASGTGVAK